MNKLICAAALLSGSALTTHAQTSVGTLLLGGNFSLASTNAELNINASPIQEQHQLQFHVAPRAGYFLADNLALGLQSSYAHYKQTNPSAKNSGSPSFESKVNEYALGPFVRYYKMISEKAGFFGQVTAAYSILDGKSGGSHPTSTLVKQRGRGFYASAAPGFVFFPTPKLGLELLVEALDYTNYHTKTTEARYNEPLIDSSQKTSTFGANFGLASLALGAAFYLNQ